MKFTTTHFYGQKIFEDKQVIERKDKLKKKEKIN